MTKKYSTTSLMENIQSPIKGAYDISVQKGVVSETDKNGMYVNLPNGNDVSRLYIPYGNVYELPPTYPISDFEPDLLFLESQIYPLISRDTLSTSSGVLAFRPQSVMQDSVNTSSRPIGLNTVVVIIYSTYSFNEPDFLRINFTGLDDVQVYSTISFRESSFSDSVSTSSIPGNISFQTLLIVYDNSNDSLSTASIPLGVTVS